MATVIHKTTLQRLDSAHSPDYASGDWWIYGKGGLLIKDIPPLPWKNDNGRLITMPLEEVIAAEAKAATGAKQLQDLSVSCADCGVLAILDLVVNGEKLPQELLDKLEAYKAAQAAILAKG